MEVNSTNLVQLKWTGENEDYILLLPVGASIKEALEAATRFHKVLGTMYQNYLQEMKKKEEPNEKKEELQVENEAQKKN